ncbi:MAG: TonB-dependent receptor [Planctomycetota bacterium]
MLHPNPPRVLSSLALPLLAVAASAQDTAASDPPERGEEAPVGETLVTARKWRESVEDVPGSVSVIDSEDLETAGWETLREAAGSVPNVNITEFSARRLSFPYVRGVGSGQGDPSVITYIDGVPQFGSGGLNLPLIGVERVEFLRGPQGTLYGRNALGGVMQVVTRAPGPELEYGARATFGNYDRRDYGLYVSGPVDDKGTGFSFEGVHSERDGYTRNNFSGNDVNDRDSFFGRGQLLFAPDDDSEVRLSVFGERSRDGGFILSDINALEDDPFRINQDFEGVVERDVIAPSLTWTRYGDSTDFVSISAFQAWEVRETSDFDFSPIDGVRRLTEESQDYFYQELRLQSAEDSPVELGEDTDMRWLAGISGFVSDSERSAANDFRPGGEGIFFPPGAAGVNTDSGDFEDLAVGVFGQTTVTHDEDLDLTLGLRFDTESKDADLRNTFVVGGFTAVDNRSEEDETYSELLPHVSAAYRTSESSQVYALASRGFKAGGFNLAAPAGLTEFDTETSWTYEIGAKATLADGDVRLGVAAFHIDWEDMQLSQFDATAGGYVQNVGESTSTGVEVEAAADVHENVSIYGGFGYVDTEFDEFVDSFGSDVAGNELPYAPETTWSVGALFSAEVAEDTEVFLRGDLSVVGDFYFDAGNLEQESYSLTDFRAGVQRGAFGLTVTLRNAFDEEYIPVAFQPSPVDPTAFIGENGLPRTLLVTLSFDA